MPLLIRFQGAFCHFVNGILSFPGSKIIKLFTSVIYESSQKAWAFVNSKPIQIFVGKAGANPSEASF
jgi:hypothetical protein